MTEEKKLEPFPKLKYEPYNLLFHYDDSEIEEWREETKVWLQFDKKHNNDVIDSFTIGNTITDFHRGRNSVIRELLEKGFDVASLIYRAILESDKSTGKILEDNLDKMVVIPEELWAKTLKLANIEDDRAKFFKERHDEDHAM